MLVGFFASQKQLHFLKNVFPRGQHVEVIRLWSRGGRFPSKLATELDDIIQVVLVLKI